MKRKSMILDVKTIFNVKQISTGIFFVEIDNT